MSEEYTRIKTTIDKVQIFNTILEGLMIDGGHHKQYFLEKAIRELLTKEDFEKIKRYYGWEEGF
jgi:hypothetical protein